MPYLWLKAVHVAAVLIFIGGLFAQSFAVSGQRDGGTVARVSGWDRRVTVPAMLLVWLTGATIAAEGAWFGSPWLWAKLAFVLALTGLHGVQSGRLRRLRRGETVESRVQTRYIAAFLAGSVAVIALLVVVKPFQP